MCGIAGIFSMVAPLEALHIKTMADALRHRGPDDEGYLAADFRGGAPHHLTGDDSKVEGTHIDSFTRQANIFLAHRRLSIIDPSPAGHQPLSNSNGSLWIIFNGELYNYIELREELKHVGYSFVTATDTEVILAAYEQWGEDCLSRFNGMWAFVIYDRKKNILFGSRDRFGVKPFYYFSDNRYFAFASEIKALLCLPFVEKRVNPEAVFDFLVLRMEEHEEEGMFSGIRELQPSYAFEYDLAASSLKKWKYYELRYTNAWTGFHPAASSQFTERIRELVFEAVRLRLRSDVPVGSCLSGGIDSSAIVCIVNRILGEAGISSVGDRQKVFTACYDQQGIDECGWAGKVVERTRTSWFRVFPSSAELGRDIEDLVYLQDVPFGSTSIYAQYRVIKLAKENGIKVLLDGQGGDELFTGYTTYYRAFFAEMIRHCSARDIFREWNSLVNAPVTGRHILASLAAKVLLPGILPVGLKAFAFRALRKENAYISGDFWEMSRDRLRAAGDKAVGSLNRMLYEWITRLSLKTLLRYEDRNSMRFSLEARTPFADDRDLIEYLFLVPSVYKIHNGWSKYLLRESMKDIVPQDILQRRDKKGFTTPEYAWTRELKEQFLAYFTDDLQDFLDVPGIRKDWDRLIEMQPRNGITGIWRFINLAIWKKVYGL